MMGHYDQDTAASHLKLFLPLLNLQCSPDVHTFLCKAFVPACFEQTRVVQPCRSLCARVYEDCKKMIDMFEIGWPKELECSRLKDCDETAAVTASFTTRAKDTRKISGQPRRDYGFWCPPGIISLNHVRQVIQNDGRNQEKLKKFMIRIGVFSGLYLVPLAILLGCYIYEQMYRKIWETTWVYDHCDQFHIPCPYQAKTLARPEITLFLMKYLMTLIVGISPVFWIGSKKTFSEWASFFNRNRKRDPISESRRVLQESCEFFLKHNSKAKHKKKHYKSSSHKLKVISKSMGTSTGATSNHGTSAVAIANHDYLSHEVLTEMKSCPEASEKELEADVVHSQRVEEEGFPHSEQSMLQVRSSPKVPVEHQEQESKGDNKQDIASLSESMKRVAEKRITPKNDITETLPLQLGHSHLSVSQPGSTKGSGLLMAHSSSDSRKAHESGHSSNG
ncbi:frizzled-6 [Crotalus adamanteus]|uniref:Frizzled-6 n=1 Tax=Crotalus adamanteus TaxID=8729 RepID=A0AAW1BP19_CROAD